MARYVVECVTIDYDAPHDDCRCIERVGFSAAEGGITTRTPAEVYDLIESAGHTVAVTYHGTERTVQGVTDGDRKYVRTESTDTSADPLLKQPSC
jgi:hypothetical protein